MKINSSIFKAYDIRGKYPSELNEGVVERIGYAIAEFLAKKRRKASIRVLVMRDVRVSSPTLRDALVRGIIAQGSDVLDGGIATTPLFYFSVRNKTVDGGVMVTASHNPAEYNGFKIRSFGGLPVFSGGGLEKIQSRAMRGEHPKSRILGNISFDSEWLARYTKFLTRAFGDIKIKAAIDASGGSVAAILPTLFHSFPRIQYTPLFFDVDGSFRRHSPNPLLPAAQTPIKNEMRRGEYQFGALFDGDGDRIVFFDEKGNMARSDWIAGILAEDELVRKPGGSYVFSVNCSRTARRRIALRAGKIFLSRIGYVFIGDEMRRRRARLGAEISGHIYFQECGYDDSAVFAFLKLAALLERRSSALSELLRPLSTAPSTGEINYPVRDIVRTLAAVKKAYRGGQQSLLDGVSIEFPDWWFNIRPSNTEPVVRLVIEADTEELLREKRAEIEKLLR